jgi:trigger factor
VTDEDVQKALEREQEQNSRLVTVEDRPVEKGDLVTLDYAGTMDGRRLTAAAQRDRSWRSDPTPSSRDLRIS